jgi:hypothetical protein
MKELILMAQPEMSANQPETIKPRKSLRSVGKVALTHTPQSLRQPVENIAMRRIMRAPGFETKHLTDGDTEPVREALELEQNVWDEKKYGSLEDYKKYLAQSRIFAAFEGGKVIGVNRLFAGSPEVPPFIDTMQIDDAALRQDLVERGRQHKVEEFGTVAVDKQHRGGRVFLDLCRISYRDATERGIETWGIIVEPERVEQMNRLMAFTFKQIGPTEDYQGGLCAPHIMDFEEVRHSMSSTKPELYDWFVNQPL